MLVPGAAHAASSVLPGFLLQFVLVQLLAAGAPDGQKFTLVGPRIEEGALAAGAGRNGKATSVLSRQREQRLFPAVVVPGHLVTGTGVRWLSELDLGCMRTGTDSACGDT